MPSAGVACALVSFGSTSGKLVARAPVVAVRTTPVQIQTSMIPEVETHLNRRCVNMAAPKHWTSFAVDFFSHSPSHQRGLDNTMDRTRVPAARTPDPASVAG